jgi:hypothetical protein
MKVWINDCFVSKEAMEEIDKHWGPGNINAEGAGTVTQSPGRLHHRFTLPYIPPRLLKNKEEDK